MTGLASKQPVQVVLQSFNGKGWGPATPVKATTTL